MNKIEIQHQIDDEIKELERSLLYCSELAFAADSLGNYLPMNIEYPIAIDTHIEATAKRIFEEWKRLQQEYVFVMVSATHPIVRGITIPIFLKRADDLTEGNVRNAIENNVFFNDKSITTIGILQQIGKLNLDDCENVHPSIQEMIDNQ